MNTEFESDKYFKVSQSFTYQGKKVLITVNIPVEMKGDNEAIKEMWDSLFSSNIKIKKWN